MSGRLQLRATPRIKSESSSRRTYVWRQLRQLGAVYLQQAVAVLPDRPGLRHELDRLGVRIQSGGGEASFLETTSPTPAWEEELVARFNAARDAEYEEILDSVEGFEDEIRRETRHVHDGGLSSRGSRARCDRRPQRQMTDPLRSVNGLVHGLVHRCIPLVRHSWTSGPCQDEIRGQPACGDRPGTVT